eukprot:2158714-Prymnesium_polylepis.1
MQPSRPPGALRRRSTARATAQTSPARRAREWRARRSDGARRRSDGAPRDCGAAAGQGECAGGAGPSPTGVRGWRRVESQAEAVPWKARQRRRAFESQAEVAGG